MCVAEKYKISIFKNSNFYFQGTEQNGHICGSFLPATQNTSSNSLFIQFITDSATSGKGKCSKSMTGDEIVFFILSKSEK